MATERGLILAEKLWEWRPYSATQRDWVLCDAPVKIGCWGRRAGKSTSTAIDVVLFALENPNTIQIVLAPTDDQTRIMMSEIRRLLYAVPGLASQFTDRMAPHQEIVFRDGGNGTLTEPTTIMARTTGTDGRGLRGRRAHRVIVDEAAFVSDAIMGAVVTPLLADYADQPCGGQLILISTPKGSNHFRVAYTRGLDPLQPRYQSFHCPSTANPYLSKSYLENEKATKPERVWDEEFGANFQEDAGGVFRKVSEAVDKGRAGNEPPVPGARYFAGWDLARINDFSVLTIFDQNMKQVYLDRFQKMDWEGQVERVKRALDRYNSASVLMDATGGLESVSQMARKAGVKATPFVFTNTSKTAIMDNLAVKIETGTRLLDNPVQTGELQSYAYTLTASRNVQMNAPAGQHDDCVCALALAAHAVSTVRYATAL